jgi:phosphatidylserine decarboxylase
LLPARAPQALAAPPARAAWRFGRITDGRIFQAKGHDYSATALLGGDAALAAHFHGGHFATPYLSPKDYHRIHMPCAGRLLRMVHVPGELFSVNPTTARSGQLRDWSYTEQRVELPQGAEMGRFLLGSTVVLLFPQAAALRFNDSWAPGGAVRMGQEMAQLG